MYHENKAIYISSEEDEEETDDEDSGVSYLSRGSTFYTIMVANISTTTMAICITVGKKTMNATAMKVVLVITGSQI